MAQSALFAVWQEFQQMETVEKVKIRHHRRTCADDGDTDREIVCEEQSDECAISRKILSRGISKGGTGR